jgi:hypothetical protein
MKESMTVCCLKKKHDNMLPEEKYDNILPECKYDGVLPEE